MPAMGVPREATDLIETTAVSFRTGQKGTILHSASLQNPTEWRRNSPFFGSVLRRLLLAGTAVDRVGDHEIKVCDGGEGRNIVIVNQCCPKKVRAVHRNCLIEQK